MTPKQIDDLVRTLCLLVAAYEPSPDVDLDAVDNVSYAAGFRAGARSAYTDTVCRLREVKAGDLPENVTRIGATA